MVVFPLHHIRRLQTPRGIKVQDLLFHHGILGDHLLHLTFQSHVRGIFIIRCGVQIEIAQRLGTICISLVRLLDIAIVVQEIQRTVALRTEVAPLPLQFFSSTQAISFDLMP